MPQATNLVLEYYATPFNTWPLLNPSVTDSNFVYIDISLLTIQIAAKTNRTCDLSWNSAAGMTNYVEFTTNFPPVWQLLRTTNGNGSTMKPTDPMTTPPCAFSGNSAGGMTNSVDSTPNSPPRCSRKGRR